MCAWWSQHAKIENCTNEGPSGPTRLIHTDHSSPKIYAGSKWAQLENHRLSLDVNAKCVFFLLRFLSCVQNNAHTHTHTQLFALFLCHCYTVVIISAWCHCIPTPNCSHSSLELSVLLLFLHNLKSKIPKYITAFVSNKHWDYHTDKGIRQSQSQTAVWMHTAHRAAHWLNYCWMNPETSDSSGLLVQWQWVIEWGAVMKRHECKYEGQHFFELLCSCMLEIKENAAIISLSTWLHTRKSCSINTSDVEHIGCCYWGAAELRAACCCIYAEQKPAAIWR